MHHRDLEARVQVLLRADAGEGTDQRADGRARHAARQLGRADLDRRIGSPRSVRTNAEQAASDAAGSAAATQASAAKDVEAATASVASSQNGLATAQDALAAAQDQAAAKLAADQTAVDNAQKALDAARAVVATSPAILAQQLEKAKDDLWAAQISRDLACSRGGGGACDAAKATVAGLETAVTNFNATAQQTQKQNDQTVQSAKAQVDTTKATLASDQAAQAAAIKTAASCWRRTRFSVARSARLRRRAWSAAASSERHSSMAMP